MSQLTEAEKATGMKEQKNLGRLWFLPRSIWIIPSRTTAAAVLQVRMIGFEKVLKPITLHSKFWQYLSAWGSVHWYWFQWKTVFGGENLKVDIERGAKQERKGKKEDAKRSNPTGALFKTLKCPLPQNNMCCIFSGNTTPRFSCHVGESQSAYYIGLNSSGSC